MYSCCEYLLDVKKTFIAREQPLASYLDARDYSQPLECDLLLVSADANSYYIVEYLLELGIFSHQSIEKAYQYAKLNSDWIRLKGSIKCKCVDVNNKIISLLEKYNNA